MTKIAYNAIFLSCLKLKKERGNDQVSEETMQNVDFLTLLKGKIELEVEGWQKQIKRLDALKSLPQFLDIFSSEEIMKLNKEQRAMLDMVDILREAKDKILSEEISPKNAGELDSILKLSKMGRLKAKNLVREKAPKVFQIKLNFFHFLFHPCLSFKFLILKIMHKKWEKKNKK